MVSLPDGDRSHPSDAALTRSTLSVAGNARVNRVPTPSVLSHRYTALVRAQHAVDDREPEPRPLSCGLGRIEGLEDVLHQTPGAIPTPASWTSSS